MTEFSRTEAREHVRTVVMPELEAAGYATFISDPAALAQCLRLLRARGPKHDTAGVEPRAGVTGVDDHFRDE